MADVAKVAVANRALFLLGQEPVTDLSEAQLAQSNAAYKVSLCLDAARETLLARHGWVCALEYAALSPAITGEPVNFRYPTTFVLPGDAIRVWEVAGQRWSPHEIGGFGPRWQVGTMETGQGARQVIRAAPEWPWGLAIDKLHLAYVRRCAWAALDANLTEAVAYEAAKRSCYSITGDVAMTSGLKKEAEDKALMAVSCDGTQEGGQPPQAVPITHLIRNMSR